MHGGGLPGMIEVVRTGSAGQRSGRSEGRRLQGWENDALESWGERKEGRMRGSGDWNGIMGRE